MKFINPLNDFRVSSYYFAIAICDSTNAARDLAESADLSVWDHPDRDASELGTYTPKISQSGGSYCILLNGSSDSNFVVDQAEWNTITSGTAVFGDLQDSILLEGTMRISEPRGVIFSDTLVLCFKALGIDSAMATFLIKPFFTGYKTTENGEDQYALIADVEPIAAVLTNYSGAFSEIGGLYELEFVSAGNGLTRYSQYSKTYGITFSSNETSENSTVGTALDSLSRKLNFNYETYYNCVFKAAESSDKSLIDPEKIVPLHYIIGCDQVFKDLKISWPEHYLETKCGNDFVFATIPGASVEYILHEILNLSEALKEGKLKDPVSNLPIKYKVKTTVYFESDETSGELKQVNVIFYVDQFISPRTPFETEDVLTSLSSNNQEELKRHVMEFDYLYSGNNLDILNFDMKMSVGIAYLQSASSINSLPGTLQAINSRTIHFDPSINYATRLGLDKQNMKYPLFMDLQQPAITTNYGGISPAEHLFTMAHYAAYESLNSSMTIRGNPYLLGKASLIGNPWTVLDKINGVGKTWNDSIEDKPAPNFGYIPLMAKVNIFMPSTNDDLQILQDRTMDYSKQFWFSGLYYVFEVKHNFNDDGTFTQTFTMGAIPEQGDFDTLEKRVDSSKEISKRIDECLKNFCSLKG